VEENPAAQNRQEREAAEAIAIAGAAANT
jgi:hypothetical protein